MTDKGLSLDSYLAPEGNALASVYNFLIRLRGLKALMLALVCGAASNLAFAPLYIWPAMALAVILLVWLLDGASHQEKPRLSAFWRAFMFGLGLFGVGFHWVAFAFLVNASEHVMFIWLAALLPAGLAFIWGVTVAVMMNLWSAGPARVILMALMLFVAEWIRGHLFGGFPWNLPGMVWRPGGAISQSVSIWGIWGLTALTLFAFAAPAALVDSRRGIGAKGGMLARVAPAIIAALGIGVIWGWGSQRLSLAETESFGPTVRLVDVGVPQSEKFKPEVRIEVLKRYLTLTEPDSAQSPRIVIWPEGALPYALLQYPDALDPVTANLGGRRLIVGTSFVNRLEHPERWYNALAVLSRDSGFSGPQDIYYKHRLVPFGEMVPFRGVAARIGLSALQEIAESGFHAGPPPSVISVEGIPDFEPLVCYEALFAGLMPRRDMEQSDVRLPGDTRPEWMVNISIDAWFGPLWAPLQHMEHARFRAIEEGLPMARVASRGVSGVIDGYGRLTHTASAPDEAKFGPDPEGWKGRVLDAQLPPALAPTFYSRQRGLILFVLLVLLVVGRALLPRN